MSSTPEKKAFNNSVVVEEIFQTAINEYFEECELRIQPFINRHFHYPGAWNTNKSALGWDLLRAPFNLFWAPVFVTAQLLAWAFRKVKLNLIYRLLKKIPSGLSTTVQRKVALLLSAELLQQTDSASNGLQQKILFALDELVEPDIQNQAMLNQLSPIIGQALAQYNLTRTASADITNSILSTLLGAFAFKKFTPGGIAIGLLLASWLAQKNAVEGFFLGNFLGGLFYWIFPVDPSLGIILSTTTIVLAAFAVFASFSGLITDPIQGWTGLHRYRLKKLLRHLQQDFRLKTHSSFSPKDPYVARILEILDAAKSQFL